MSVLHTNHDSVPLGAISIFRAVSLAEGTLGALGAWRRSRATRRTLAALSDAQLADIGLTRGQIGELAAALARR
jgi:uncharacterized protein YjiS (DUF1127 family)